jgi:putative ABC transport system substrate-binding protein
VSAGAIDRRCFLAGSVVGVLATTPSAQGQQRKPYRIGVLEVVEESANAANLDAFRQGLRDLGYVDNVSIEYRSADGRAERFSDLAGELVRLKVDVIVTRGTPAALAAKQATATIPIVMASSGDPAAEGIVASLARPGGNVTGLHMMGPASLGSRRLQLLKEMVPGLSRVAVLWNPVSHYAPLLVRDTERVARAMAIQCQSFEVQRPEELERAFEAIILAQVDGLITVEDYLTLTQRAPIVDFAAMSRIPAIHGLREFVDAGGLVAYGIDRRDLFRRSATYVHKILNGARPADLPVGEPSRFELVINRKTARALGLTVPPSMLGRADHVVE